MQYKDLEQVGARLPTFVTQQDIVDNPLPLICNRTMEDVEYLQKLYVMGWDNLSSELQKWWLQAVHRGALLADDLNRIGLAVNFVAVKLCEHGYPLVAKLKVDWQQQEIFYTENLRELLVAVALLRERLAHFADTPSVPEGLSSWQEVNAVEKIIGDVFVALNKMLEGLPYADTVWCGIYPL